MRAWMLGAFGLVCALLVTLELLETREADETRSRIELIRNNVLVSMRLVGELEADVERERILIDRHVFERDQKGLEGLEQQLAVLREHYRKAASAYEPLARFPGEAEEWHRLSADVAAARGAAESALQASREDRDGDAVHVVVDTVDPLFDRIAVEVTSLADINEAAADRAVAELAQVHRRNVQFRFFFVIAIIGAVAAGGGWLTRRVAGAHDKLAKANRELDAFAGRVAHDLRSPLTAVGLAATLLTEQAPEARSAARAITNGVARMSKLVADLLALSRVGQPSEEVAATAPVAAAVERELAPQINAVGGTLRVDLAAADVRGSEGLLGQVLRNLGENAIKYRDPARALVLELRGRVEHDAYVIAIEDNGLGMSEDDALHAFEPLYRSPRTKKVEGTGLGLSIVKRIVEACGGRIAIASRLDHGTTFTIKLRVAREERRSSRAPRP